MMSGKRRIQKKIKCACGCGEELFLYSTRLRNGRADLNKKRRYIQYHHCRTNEAKEALRERASGANNKNWKGGVSIYNAKTRQSAEYRQWTYLVLKRDHFMCQVCGKHANQAHHIIRFSTNEELRLRRENGIALCKRCHEATYGREEFFEEMFSAMVAKRVNSVEVLPDDAGDNTEPSLGGDTEEGVTTRGLDLFVRPIVFCDYCGKRISRCRTKILEHKRHFCSKKCQYKVVKPPRAPSPKGMIWSELHSNMQK